MTEFFKPAPVDPFFPVRSDHAAFGCGGDNPIALRLRLASDRDGVKSSFAPNPEHQGFHDVVHGGIISTILDEAMAWATAHASVWAVTSDTRVRYRQPLEIGEVAIVTARQRSSRSPREHSRRARARSRPLAGRNRVCHFRQGRGRSRSCMEGSLLA